MKKITIVAVAVIACIPAQTWAGESHQPLRPVHTYSIVARDAATGELARPCNRTGFPSAPARAGTTPAGGRPVGR